jgi:ubiquinol-cytochrome c reductase cytochrome b subunit
LLDRPRDRPKRTAIGAGFLAFYFCLFAASSTDVLANFFHVSLNIVLWSFRFIVIIVPIIVGFVTWRICLDMAGVPGIGKRKRAVVVMRTATGEYATVQSPQRPGDGHEEAEPELVPRSIEISDDDGLDPVPAGVRRVDRS